MKALLRRCSWLLLSLMCALPALADLANPDDERIGDPQLSMLPPQVADHAN